MPPAPADPATEVTLEVERIRRSAPPVTVVADAEQAAGRIRVAVLRRREGIQECFERILPTNPDAAGRIDFAFTVETSGLVHDAVAETAVAPLRPVKECVLSIIRATRIEGIDHPAQVRFPVEFENPLLELTLTEMAVHPRMRTEGPTSAAVAVQAGRGDLTADEAQAVIDLHAAEVLACYAPLLRPTPRRGQSRPQGSARFEVMVAPSGEVVDIDREAVSDPVPQATECIQGVLQALHFRATGRRTLVRARFAMRPQE